MHFVLFGGELRALWRKKKFPNFHFFKTKLNTQKTGWFLVEVLYLVNIFGEVSQAQVVHDVPSTNQQRNTVRSEQLEVVLVGLVSKKRLDLIWNIKKMN